MSGYKEALEAAGAEILCYETFGSYQGDWWTKVVYNGDTFWINGSYGSCSGCDAFESEFGYSSDQGCEDHKYSPEDDCAACNTSHKLYLEKLALFGSSYLTDCLTQEEAEAKASEHLSWDMNAEEMVKFIQDNHI
jgi:hypothetical protein